VAEDVAVYARLPQGREALAHGAPVGQAASSRPGGLAPGLAAPGAGFAYDAALTAELADLAPRVLSSGISGNLTLSLRNVGGVALAAVALNASSYNVSFGGRACSVINVTAAGSGAVQLACALVRGSPPAATLAGAPSPTPLAALLAATSPAVGAREVMSPLARALIAPCVPPSDVMRAADALSAWLEGQQDAMELDAGGSAELDDFMPPPPLETAVLPAPAEPDLPATTDD
jgi:hypothetical protein